MNMDIDIGPRPQDHVGTLQIRRYLAGELDAATRAALELRMESDATLRAQLRSLQGEQDAFAKEISFERFAGGVERARREQANRKPSRLTGIFTRRVTLAGMGLAAAAALVLVFLPHTTPPGRNRLMGSIEDITVRIAPGDGGPQRNAHLFEVLAQGDRLRIGYACKTTLAPDQCSGVRHLSVISIDQTGEVSAIYPEAGNAIAVEPGPEGVFLPDSFEFTGNGLERLLVLVADQPFTVDAARRRARARFDARAGNIEDTGAWRELPGADDLPELAVHPYLFRKP